MSLRAVSTCGSKALMPIFSSIGSKRTFCNKSTTVFHRHFSSSPLPEATDTLPPPWGKIFTFGLGACAGAIFTLNAILIITDQKKKNADSERVSKYLMMLTQYPTVLGPVGDAAKGEIEIVTDPKKIKEIEITKKQRVGILTETAGQICVCDAVKFPDGTYGTHSRILLKTSS